MTRFQVKTSAAWLTLTLFFVATGYQEEGRSFSCHLCRNLKTQRTFCIWFIPVASSETTRHAYLLEPGHTHNWYRYSRFTITGYRGWLGASVGCSGQQYRDGKRPQRELQTSNKKPSRNTRDGF